MRRLLILSDDAPAYADLLGQLDETEIHCATTIEAGRRWAAQANILLGRPDYVAGVLDVARRLAWVQSTFAGVDALCRPGLRRDYLLTGVKGIFGQAMSEYVFGQLLGLERGLYAAREDQRQQRWVPAFSPGIAGRTFGIAGLGSIGRHLAGTAVHFGMRVLGLRRHPGPVAQFENVYTIDQRDVFLAQLDYLVLALPETSDTRGLIDARALSELKPGAALINVGRGAVVEEAALVDALRSGRLRAAILDVFASEPLPRDHPFWRMDQVLLTPHIAALSAPADVVPIFRDNYLRFRQRRRLRYLVDFERGY